MVVAVVAVAVSGLAVGAAKAGADSAPTSPLRIGLLPTIATLSLLRLYDPLRLHLQDSLGRPVELYTSGSFHDYLDDVREETFDIIVTAPHFGVIAADHGYVPLFRYKLELRPLIIVPKGSDIRSASQLRGKRVLTADRLTALSVVAELWLRSDHGLVAGRDYQLVEASNHSTAIRAVALGEADAAISGRSPLAQVPPEISGRVETFECRLTVPHQFTMAHPRLGAETVEAIRRSLAAFDGTERGKAFLKAGGFLGLIPIEFSDIETARPYASVVDHPERKRP
ncbi:phosphate ABC transporter substrate-binding protein [Paramagnetospirillum marisnigri]|uniref:Phosphate ABC transporter substrate-binding protein n=2 Tax=Paramagnetospirillum marisnigri TaxID=1285242 RepID=A0A178MXA5_9PROT|nr:phosphate ABC transporter substrate-binding protein [Paramagnetospirillum marisnigri]